MTEEKLDADAFEDEQAVLIKQYFGRRFIALNDGIDTMRKNNAGHFET